VITVFFNKLLTIELELNVASVLIISLKENNKKLHPAVHNTVSGTVGYDHSFLLYL
jgi:hypothetical protein